ncbi:MAG: regulatory protein [Candidatus Saccharibacteria bacterium]|nr:regulatory protein [Candidatus Saccharibacteria bacterium]
MAEVNFVPRELMGGGPERVSPFDVLATSGHGPQEHESIVLAQEFDTPELMTTRQSRLLQRIYPDAATLFPDLNRGQAQAVIEQLSEKYLQHRRESVPAHRLVARVIDYAQGFSDIEISRWHKVGIESLYRGRRIFCSKLAEICSPEEIQGIAENVARMAAPMLKNVVSIETIELSQEPEKAHRKSAPIQHDRDTVASIGRPAKLALIPLARGEGEGSNWRLRGACRSENPDLFMAKNAHEAKGPIAICRRCPVTSECLNEALKTGQRYGVWGGLTQGELRILQKKIKAKDQETRSA